MDTDKKPLQTGKGAERFATRMSTRGRVTIPKPLRDAYGMHGGTEVEAVPDEDGILIRVMPPHPVDGVRGIKKLQFASSVDEYIEEIRGR